MGWGGTGSSGSGWGSGSSGAGSVSITLPKPKKSSGGILGFGKNLIHDVTTTAVGLPMGLVETVRNPVKTAKAFGEAEWHSWSPLLKGDFGEWGHQFMEHPLAPILDIATVVTLGAGASGRIAYEAAAAGRIGAEAGVAGRVAKLATTPEGRYINPTQAVRRQATGKILDKSFGTERRQAAAERRAFLRDQHQVGFNIARVMRGAERTAKRDGEFVPQDVRTVFAHITNQTAKISRAGILSKDEVKRGRVYLADHTKMGVKEVEAPDGHYFHQKSRGRYEVRPLPDVKNLHLENGLPAPLRASKKGAWEVSPAGNVAVIHSIERSRDRAAPKGTGTSGKSRPIREDDGTYTITGGFSKSLTTEHLDPAKGMVWQKVAPGKYKQVPDPGLSKRKLLAGHGQQIVEKTGKKGGYFRLTHDPSDPTGQVRSIEELTKAVHGHELRGQIFTTDPARAMKNQDGVPLHVNRHVVKEYHAEAANSAHFLAKAYHYPLTIWRHLILGTPRYFVNNAVGNTTMALVNNPTAMRYYVEAVRHIKGENAAREIIKDNTGSSLTWFDPLFGDMRTVPGHQVGHTAVGNIEDVGLKRKGPVGAAERAGNAWFSWVNRVTDEPFRVASTIQRVRSDAHVKNLMAKGLSEHDAVMARAAENPEWRHAISNEVENMFGNYYAMTRAERNIRNFVPFYAWDKAISRSTKNTVLDRPGRSLALAYAGHTGYDKTKEKLGEMPRFLQGAIPGPFEHLLPGIDRAPGRQNVLTTSGLNPYGTIADLASGAAAVTGLGGRPSESLGQTLGPFAQTGFEVMTGTDLLTGKPLRTNPIGTLQTNLGVSTEQPGLPQLRILKEALQPSPDHYVSKKTNERSEKLYDPSVVREWYQIFGIPIKSLNKGVAQERGAAEVKGGTL